MITEKLEPHMKIVPKIMVLAMSICCIVCCGVGVYSIIFGKPFASDPSIVSVLMMIIPGILLLLTINRPPRYPISIFAVVVGIVDIIANAPYFFSEYLSVVLPNVFVDLIFIASGIHAFLGDQHSASRLFYISLIQILFHTGSILTAVVANAMNDTLSLTEMTAFLSFSMANYILYTLFLLQPGIREETIERKLKRGMTAVEAMLSISPEAFILRKDVPAIIGEDMSAWTPIQEGPIECFHEAKLYDGNRIFKITSKKWRDDGTLVIGIDQDILTSSYGSTICLRAHRIEEIDGETYLRIYGDDGYFARMLLRDKAPNAGIRRLIHKKENEEKSNIIVDTEEAVIGQ